MLIHPFIIRQSILKKTRTFFDTQGFQEFTLPTLHSTIPTEPYIYPFSTVWNSIHGKRTRFLSTSPEAGLKKALTLGYPNIYEIAHVYRDLEEEGSTHTPEFLMLEWYRTNATYLTIMDDVETYIKTIIDTPEITYQGHIIPIAQQWPRLSVSELFQKYLDIQLERYLSIQSMRNLAKSAGYETADATWEQLFFQLFLNEIEPHIGRNPLFITDYPSVLSPLSRPTVRDPRFAQRFELYIAGMEIGNGNTENTNCETIKDVFIKEIDHRKNHEIVASHLDEGFLTSIAATASLHPSGVGMGLDRLTMLIGNLPDIRILSSFA